MTKTDITVTTEERQGGVMCEIYHHLHKRQRGLIGLLGCTPKCRLSQVIKSRKSEVDPQGIDEENYLR